MYIYVCIELGIPVFTGGLCLHVCKNPLNAVRVGSPKCHRSKGDGCRVCKRHPVQVVDHAGLCHVQQLFCQLNLRNVRSHVGGSVTPSAHSRSDCLRVLFNEIFLLGKSVLASMVHFRAAEHTPSAAVFGGGWYNAVH